MLTGDRLEAMKIPVKFALYSSLVGLLLMPVSARAAVEATRQSFQTGVAPVRAPNYTPWYNLTDRYFSGYYYMNLSLTELQIDHVASNSRCTRKNRTFMISASFEQPVGRDFFMGRFDVPLLFADRLVVSRLAPASVGDYVLHLSNSQIENNAAYLRVSARF